MKYSLDDIDKFQQELAGIYERMGVIEDDPESETEFEELHVRAQQVTYRMHEYVRAIETLLNADSYGGVH